MPLTASATRPERRLRRPRQSGMTLIEVLVAILVFSFGLLGLAGLQVQALRFSTSAEDTNRAALLANQMAFAIVDTGKTNQAVDNPAGYGPWQAVVATPASGGLSNGVGTVVPVDATTATVTITWRATTARAGSANSTSRYVTQVALP